MVVGVAAAVVVVVVVVESVIVRRTTLIECFVLIEEGMNQDESHLVD